MFDTGFYFNCCNFVAFDLVLLMAACLINGKATKSNITAMQGTAFQQCEGQG